MSSNTHVFMIRHGETDSNVGGLFHGSTDIPLNVRGERQASLVAERVATLEHLSALHASPLMRAARTARAIAMRTGLEPRFHHGLAEMHFGDAEGLTLDGMTERYPALARELEDVSNLQARFPNGESRQEFHTRVRTVLDEIASQHRGERIVVVAHGGVIGSLMAQLLNEPYDWRRFPIQNCSVTHVELANDGPVAHILNDTVHLEQMSLDELSDAVQR